MNMNYLTLPLLTFNIILTCTVAQKVFYPQSALETNRELAGNEEIYGECETVEVVQTKPENLAGNSVDCDKKKKIIAVLRHRGRDRAAQHFRAEYNKICKR